MRPLTRTRRAALATFAALTTLSLAHPAPSLATGTYIHRSCITGTDISDGPTGWQPFAYSAPGSQTLMRCPSDGLQAEASVTGQLPPGEGAGWFYRAPNGTSITRAKLSMAGWTSGWNGSQGIVQVLDDTDILAEFTGTVDPQHQRVFDLEDLNTPRVTVRAICDSAWAACTNSVAWASIYQSEIYLTDDNAPQVGSWSGTLDTDQTLVGEERLSFTATDVGGGIARLRLEVDGHPTLVDHVLDQNGGRCVASDTRDDMWVYSLPRPCPAVVTAVEAIDTTKIADGWHTLTVKIVDVAHHETTVWGKRRLVANHPPANQRLPSFADYSKFVTPVVGTAIEAVNDGLWNVSGSSLVRNWARCDAQGSELSCAQIPGATGLTYTPSTADVGHRLRLFVTATNVAGTAVVSTAPSGVIAAPRADGGSTPDPEPAADPDPDPDPSPDPAPGGGAAPSGSSPTVGSAAPVAPPLPIVAVPAGVAHAMVGRVVGEASGVGCTQDKATMRFERVAGGVVKLGYGRSATAQLQLMCTNNGRPIEGARIDVVTRVGSRQGVASNVVTDGAGRALLRLAAGPGRAISVGYRMYADDPIARATATLKVSVNGRIRLSGNHRKLRNGKALQLRGRLLGGYVPRRGVTLTVQWKDRNRWRPFAQIKTNKKGVFSYAYRFTRTNRPITYTLRVQATKGQLDYPFLAVASNPVKVTVMP